jgi:mRNA-binding protein PUF3
MVRELEKNPLLAVQDQNGNHVIQKVIERVPLEYMHGIVEAFRGSVGKMSVNPYGCRVIQRLLEKVPEPQRRFFFEELHAEGDKLITDSYGNYVTQHVIEHGLPEDRSKVVDLIKAKYLLFSKHKFASNVVERCLVCGSDDQRRELVEAFIAKNDRGENELLNLLRDGYGNYVIQKLLETLSQEDYNTFVAALKPELEKCKKIVTGGKQIISVSRGVNMTCDSMLIIEKVEKKMFRYDRVDSPTAARELIEAPPTSATSSSAQSPQSTSMPSTTTSSVDDSVHTSTLIVTKDGTTPPVLIQEPTS